MGRVGRRAVVDLTAEVDESHGERFRCGLIGHICHGRQPGWALVAQDLQAKHIEAHPERVRRSARRWGGARRRPVGQAGHRSGASCGPRDQPLGFKPPPSGRANHFWLSRPCGLTCKTARWISTVAANCRCAASFCLARQVVAEISSADRGSGALGCFAGAGSRAAQKRWKRIWRALTLGGCG